MTMNTRDALRQSVAVELGNVLADTAILYLKTHNFHWNVTGLHFSSLHTLFEQQYQAMWLALDEIAERIRALGFPAPGTYSAFHRLSVITESEALPAPLSMVETLLKDHERVIERLQNAYALTESAADQPTLDLLVRRTEAHQKDAWMLRSTLA